MLETLPAITPDNGHFWDAANRGVLALPTCRICLHIWYPPSALCPSCLSREVEFRETSGRGKVWSWIVMHRQYFREFPPPYVVLFVKLEEGPMMMSMLGSGVEYSMLRCDLPVQAVFERLSDGFSVLKFRPA